MIVFFAGDLHGHINRFYDDVDMLEKELGIKADWVLQTGNFGIWPDPARATKRANSSDFAKLYVHNTSVPRPTLFIAGKHEDHRWLKWKFSRGEMQLLPNLHFLVNGYKTVIGKDEDEFSVVGLGKVFSPKTYIHRKKPEGQYTRKEVERACSQGPTDLILSHEASEGSRLGVIQSQAQGINKILFATRPKLLVHGCYNVHKEYSTPKTGVGALALSHHMILAYEYHDGQFTPIK